jgi:hypothetical protein
MPDRGARDHMTDTVPAHLDRQDLRNDSKRSLFRTIDFRTIDFRTIDFRTSRTNARRTAAGERFCDDWPVPGGGLRHNQLDYARAIS